MESESLTDGIISTSSESVPEKDFVGNDIPTETVVPGNFYGPVQQLKEEAGIYDAKVAPEKPAEISPFEVYENAFRYFLGTSTEEAQQEYRFKPKAPTVTWEDIWAHTLKFEGGYANNPLDPGGETNYGISRSSYPNLNIRALTPEDAKAIFKIDYFDKVEGDILLQINPGVAAHVADMAFNAGPTTAINLLYDSVGLPRKDEITDELLSRISKDESTIESYSKARLSYYSSLYSAPTFIKSWINRVSNLNRALGTKSGLGGAYAAARDLDVEYLVQNQYGSYRNAQPRFRDLDESERRYLSDREEQFHPGLARALATDPADIDDTARSSIPEVLRASYEHQYFTQEGSGLRELVNREAIRASEINRQALGDVFEKSNLEKVTLGLYGGVTDLKSFQKELEDFKQNYPDVKLPVSDASQVFESAALRARQIEDNYNRLESGSFFDGLGSAAAKLGHVALGYLPGIAAGALSDPKEMALMLATGGSAGTVAQAATLGALAFLGEGVLQFDVQGRRKDLGLESGFTQGLENAAAFGVGTAAFGALSVGIKNLWKKGSLDAAKSAKTIAQQVDDIASKHPTSPDALYLKKEAGDVAELGNIYKSNAYGHDYRAKLQLDKRMAEAADDIANNRPVRVMNDPLRKFVPTDKKLVADAEKAIRSIGGEDSDIFVQKLRDQVKVWDEFKKSNISRVVYASVDEVEHSMIPVVDPQTKDMFSFKSVSEANKFLSSKKAEGLISDYAIDIFKDPKGKGYFLGRSADIEPSSALSGRMVGDDIIEDIVGGIKARGFKDSEDLAIAKQFPEHSRIREFVEPNIPDTPPVYPKDPAVIEAQVYEKQLEESVKFAKSISAEESEKKLLKRFEDMEKAHIEAGNKGPAMMDISDTIGVEERVSVSDFAKELKEDRDGLAAMVECGV